MAQSLSSLQQSVPSDVRELLVHQMNSWQQGTRLPIETIVVKAKPEHRTVAAQVLIKQEIVLREQAGEAPRLDEYLSRFPECAESLPQQFDSQNEMTIKTFDGVELRQDTAHDTYERTFISDAGSPVGSGATQGSQGFMNRDADPTLQIGMPKSEESINRMIGLYRLEKKLGQGGMGAVFKAVHTKLDKLVAIKVMSQSGSLDNTAVDRFEREMRAVGRIEHPNVIRAMDAGEADGFHYLVMEYVEGQDVSQAVKAHGPFPYGQACEIIRQSALGLNEAHAQGMVHRDIKPSNLFLTNKGIVKILDLGLARLNENQNLELTQSGLCMGTPDYMAPEQWVSARDVDGRCDIYALGCTLFHLLVGRPPFGTKEHMSLGNKVLAHTSGIMPDIRNLCADFPEELKPIIDRMLAKEKEQRFQTGAELAQALEPFCMPLPGLEASSKSELASNPSSIQGSTPSRGWTRILAYWGGGAALLALAAFIIIRVRDKDGRVAEFKIDASSSINLQLVDDKENSSTTAPAKDAKPLVAKTNPLKPTSMDITASVPPPTEATGKKKAGSSDAAVTVRPVPPSEADAAPADAKAPKEGAGKTPLEIAAVRPSGNQDASVKASSPAPSNEPAKSTKPMTTEVATVTPMNTPVVVDPVIAAVPLRLPLAAEVIRKQQGAWSRDLKQPVTQFNSIKMPFVLIPPGEFEMGATSAAVNEVAAANEPEDRRASSVQERTSALPRHHVKISRPFAVGQHEVTVGQFRQFVTATQYKTIAERETATGASLSEGVSQKKRLRQPIYSWQFAGELVLEEEQPVTNLSWYDAVAYCEWLSQKEGVIYRLPTEAEWEYVARAGLGTIVEGSDEWLEWTKQAANLADVTGLNTFGQTGLVTKAVDWDDTFAAQAPIGRFLPNILGLQDLSGNVSEWCSDRYDPEYYKLSPLENPRGPSTGASRVVRGASWQSTTEECRIETRNFSAPNQAQLHVGFRLVQELPALADADAPKVPQSVAQRDLAIAEWVLNLGGKVRVAINRAPSNEITKVADLPKAAVGTEFTVYSVNLAETGISDLGLTRLKPLTGLQELNLSGNPITDAGLEMLASFRFLQKLILSHTEVSGTGLIHLSASKKLTELDLSYCPVTDSSISPIKGLGSLTVVRLNSTSITDSALEQFKPLSALKELSLIDTRITGSGLSFLRNLAALTTLDLSETPLDNKQLKGLADLKSLRQARFNWSTINDIGLTHLNESYALTELGLRGTDVNDFDIDTLQRLKAIRKLDLRDTDFTATGVETLEKALKTKITASFGDVNARVASLCLSVGGKVVIAADRNAEPQTVMQLSGLPTSRFEIREIHLSNLPVRDGVLWMVPKLSSLRVLNLDGTNIDDSGVAAIVQAPKLQSLNLEGTRITEQALSEISSSKTLKTLSLRNNRISEDKLTELRAKLSGVEVQ